MPGLGGHKGLGAGVTRGRGQGLLGRPRSAGGSLPGPPSQAPCLAGPDPLSSLARSWQTAQPGAAPGLRLPPPPDAGAYDSEDEDTLGPVAEAEQSVLALHRCLALLEDPNAQALGARVRPPSGDAAPAAFYCPARAHVARLDALLRQRRLLRLARTLTRRLQAAAAFVRRLGHLLEQQARRERPGEPGDGQPLRSLCEELWTLAGHRRQLRDDPRLRALGPEVLAGMRQALGLLGRQATLLLERYAEGLLRSLARAGPPACPALLTDLCQGLELYNRALSEQAAEPALGSSQLDPTAPLGPQVVPGGQAQVFSSSRVLGVLAAERGRLAAQRLHRLLLQRVQAGGGGPSSWEEATAPRPPDAQIPEDAVAEELQALCRVDARLLDLVLAASPTALWHHGPAWPRQEAPETTWSSLSQLSGCRPDAEALHAQYRLLVWEAAAAALGRLLELPELLGSLAPRGGRAMLALAQELSQVLNRGRCGDGGWGGQGVGPFYPRAGAQLAHGAEPWPRANRSCPSRVAGASALGSLSGSKGGKSLQAGGKSRGQGSPQPLGGQRLPPPLCPWWPLSSTWQGCRSQTTLTPTPLQHKFPRSAWRSCSASACTCSARASSSVGTEVVWGGGQRDWALAAGTRLTGGAGGERDGTGSGW